MLSRLTVRMNNFEILEKLKIFIPRLSWGPQAHVDPPVYASSLACALVCASVLSLRWNLDSELNAVPYDVV